MSCDSGKHFSRLSRSDCSDSYAADTLTFRGMRREKEESPGPLKKVSSVGICEERGRRYRDSLHAEFLVVNVYWILT